jgi:hypothetical protein
MLDSIVRQTKRRTMTLRQKFRCQGKSRSKDVKDR